MPAKNLRNLSLLFLFPLVLSPLRKASAQAPASTQQPTAYTIPDLDGPNADPDCDHWPNDTGGGDPQPTHPHPHPPRDPHKPKPHDAGDTDSGDDDDEFDSIAIPAPIAAVLA